MAIVSGAVIFIFLHIYFLYGIVSVSHLLKAGQQEFFNNEYSYQEAAVAYQSFLRDIEKEYIAGGFFSGIDSPEFASRRSSLVLR